jgi:hypothetical protein
VRLGIVIAYKIYKICDEMFDLWLIGGLGINGCRQNREGSCGLNKGEVFFEEMQLAGKTPC